MTAPRLLQLVGGCFVLGVGVTLLLTPALGSDGFSSLVNGVSLATGMPFVLANTLVSVAFVGLAVPHVVRSFTGSDHRWLLPYCALLGPVLVLGSDVVGRVVARPGELMVGAVTAFVGAPFLIAAVRRGRAGL